LLFLFLFLFLFLALLSVRCCVSVCLSVCSNKRGSARPRTAKWTTKKMKTTNAKTRKRRRPAMTRK
jgi:hypothetical protein